MDKEEEYKRYFERKSSLRYMYYQFMLALGARRKSHSYYLNSYELIAKWTCIDPFIKFHFTVLPSNKSLNEIIKSTIRDPSANNYIDLVETVKNLEKSQLLKVPEFLLT